MSKSNRFSAGPPPTSGAPGPSSEYEYSVSEILRKMDVIEGVAKDLTFRMMELKVAQECLRREVQEFKSEQLAASRTLAESMRNLNTALESLKSGLCSRTAAQGNVQYSS